MPRSVSYPPPQRFAWFFPRLRDRVELWPWYLRWCVKWVFCGGVLGGVVFLAGAAFYMYLARNYDPAGAGRMPERTIVYDRQGREMGRLHGQNRIVVKLRNIAPVFIDALLAREDDAFYRHGGISWRGVARALYRRAKDGAQQGASTITMQLARNSFNLTREKSFHRKFLEMAITRKLESHYSKDEILELYINRIYFGNGIYGLERACQCYFGKSARDLQLDEAAMLAAIIRGPSSFSPWTSYEKAKSGRNMVLGNMVRCGRLEAAKAAELVDKETRVQAPPGRTADSWAMDAVRADLSRFLDTDERDDGGLRVFTTLDPVLQSTVQEALAGKFPKEGGRAAAIVLENKSGATLAIVGGAHPDSSDANMALSGLGSSLEKALPQMGGEAGLPEARRWMPGEAGKRTLKELTSAVSGALAGGERARPWLIDRVEDDMGVVVFRSGVMTERTLSRKQAGGLRQVLQKGPVVEVGVRQGLVAPLAGAYSLAGEMDAWVVGGNAGVVVGIWARAENGAMPAESGRRTMVPLWVEVMRVAQRAGWRSGDWGQ